MSHIPYFGQPESTPMQPNKNNYETNSQLAEVVRDYVEKQTKATIEYTEKLSSISKTQMNDFLSAYKSYSLLDTMEKIYSFAPTKDKK